LGNSDPSDKSLGYSQMPFQGKFSPLVGETPTGGLPVNWRPSVGGVARSETGHNKVFRLNRQTASVEGGIPEQPKP